MIAEDDQLKYEEANYTTVRLNKQQKKDKRRIQERLERTEQLDDFTELNNIKNITSKGQDKNRVFGKDSKKQKIGKTKKGIKRFKK